MNKISSKFEILNSKQIPITKNKKLQINKLSEAFEIKYCFRFRNQNLGFD